MILINT